MITVSGECLLSEHIWGEINLDAVFGVFHWDFPEKYSLPNLSDRQSLCLK